MRRYSSADKPAQRDAATATAALEWLPLPIALAATPGMHRFVWPLHHGAPAALAGGDAFADGVLALPGNYTIELSVDDAIYTHPLIVLPDPRIKLPAQAYVEQFELGRNLVRPADFPRDRLADGDSICPTHDGSSATLSVV